MGLFTIYLWRWRHKQACRKYKKAYFLLNKLAGRIKELAEFLSEYRQEISKYDKNIHDFKKNEFVKHFVANLEKISKAAEKKYVSATKDLEKTINPTEEEIAEIKSKISFLKSVKKILKEYEKLKGAPDKETAKYIDYMFKEVSEIAKEFYEKEVYGSEVREMLVEDYEKIHLVREIYENAKTARYCINSHEIDNPFAKRCWLCGSEVFSLYEYKFPKRKKGELRNQIRFLNSHNDKNNYVELRNWWGKLEPEQDSVYKKEHVNMDVKLYGGKQKKIHLILV